jgi:hypothetical protein
VVTRRTAGILGLCAIAATAVTLIAVELSMGAADYGEFHSADPCTAETTFPGDGLDPTIQRIALSGLNGAACELGTTREELVLSFVPEAGGPPIEGDRPTIERAVRAGLERAIDDAEQRGSIGGVTAFLLREIAERAPLDWLISGADSLAGFVGEVGEQGLAETLRERLADAIDAAELEGRLERFEALVLKRAAELAPIEWLLEQADRLLP